MERLRPLNTYAEQDDEQALNSALAGSGRAVGDFFWALNTPGAIVRSGIDYIADGQWNNPLDDAQRVSGKDLAKKFGVQNEWAQWGLGTALDIATDPLTYLTGPAGALYKGGQAAAKIGLLDDAAAVASKTLQDRVVRGATAGLTGAPAEDALRAATTSLTGRAGRTMKALGRDNIADFVEHNARPLVGQRAAQQQVTLRNLMDQAGPGAKRELDAFLNLKKWNFDDIADTPLSGSFGWGNFAGNPLGEYAGEAAALAFDRVGEAVRWSPIGRGAHWFANTGVGRQFSPQGQAQALEITRGMDAGSGKGRSIGAELAQTLRLAEIPPAVAQRTGIRALQGPDGELAAEAIDRYIGKVAATANDIDFVENTPGIKEFVDRQAVLMPQYLADSKHAGLNAHQLKHRFGEAYRPYQLTTASDRKAGAVGKTSFIDLFTRDMRERTKSLQLPGGIDQLRYYAKKKEFLGGRGVNPKTKLPYTDDEVADWLVSDVNNAAGEYYKTVPGSQAAAYPAGVASGAIKEKYGHANAKALARWLNELDPNDPVAFGNHPAEAIANYAMGRSRAIGASDPLVDAVVSRAVPVKAGNVVGGGSIPLGSALLGVGLKSQKGAVLRDGAQARAREKIAARLTRMGQAITPDKVDLSQYSVPQNVIDGLAKTSASQQIESGVSPVGDFLNQMTRVFKNQILAFPSRISRDWTSGTAGNAILAKGNFVALGKGMIASSKTLDGNYGESIEYIKSLPLYKGMSDDAALEAYFKDVAESGVLRGMGSIEREIGDRTGKSLSQIIPGATPESIRASLPSAEELLSKQSLDPFGIKGVSFGNRPRTWSQYGKDWIDDPLGSSNAAPEAQVRTSTNNPVFRSFEKLAEWSDAHVRLSGYNTLLASGVAPREAAKQVKRIHVDYESLTAAEKSLRDSAVPFYTYTARSGQYAAEELLTNPGGMYSQTLRALDATQRDDTEEYMPQSYRDRGSLRIDSEIGRALGLPDWANPGIGPDGSTRVLTGFDLPGMSAVNMLASKRTGTTPDIAASLGSTAQNAASQVSPLIRTAAEVLTGIDTFTKRPIGQVASTWDRALIGLTQNEDARLPAIGKHLLDLAVPGASRVAGVIGGVLDPRQDMGTNIAMTTTNMFSPVKVATISEQQRDRDAISAIDEMLRRMPNARTMTRTSISEEDAAALPPEFQRMLDAKKVIEKRVTKAAKERKRREARFGRGA